MLTGWLQRGSNRYFLNPPSGSNRVSSRPEGAMLFGRVHVDGVWRVFNRSGRLQGNFDSRRHFTFWTPPVFSGTTTVNYRIINNPSVTWVDRITAGATLWNSSTASVRFQTQSGSRNTVTMITSGGSRIYVGDRTGQTLNSFRIMLNSNEVADFARRSGESQWHVARYIIAHEFGHAVGLEDNPRLGSGQTSVMTQSVIRSQSLAVITSFDVTSVNMIYN
jgi:hypothetical protein